MGLEHELKSSALKKIKPSFKVLAPPLAGKAVGESPDRRGQLQSSGVAFRFPASLPSLAAVGGLLPYSPSLQSQLNPLLLPYTRPRTPLELYGRKMAFLLKNRVAILPKSIPGPNLARTCRG